MLLFSALFADFVSLMLSALLAAALFFATVGLRELNAEHQHGIMHLIIGMFFLFVHGYLLWNLPHDTMVGQNLGMWQWLIKFFAPALILLYLVLGLSSLLKARVRDGIIKIFFGTTLTCCLFVLGANWPPDVKCVLILIWGGLWFKA